MTKTKIDKVLGIDFVDCRSMLEDLNGQRTDGLKQHLRAVMSLPILGRMPEPWVETYQHFLRGYTDLWLATGRGQAGERPSSRRPTPQISLLVDQVVTSKRILPAALRDGYAMMVVAGRRPRLPRHSSLLAPGSKRLSREHAMALAAAEEMFVAMLMSEWRLRIAHCPEPTCRVYFRLGKCDQLYAEGTRCGNCQRTHHYPAVRKRVEDQRRIGRRRLYQFVAQQFAQDIVPGSPWFRNPVLKQEIAAQVNRHIQSDASLRTIFPKGLTGKWVEAGQRGKKNWRLIERAAARFPGIHRERTGSLPIM